MDACGVFESMAERQNPVRSARQAEAAISVCVSIVTYNSRRFIGPCLDTLLRQNAPPFEVVVVDNASTDGTPEVLASFGGRIRTIYNDRNIGFAAAQNQAIAFGKSSWVLTLNPDVLLLPGFIAELVRAGRHNDSVGTVCGKLLAIGSDLKPPPDSRIDSAGIYFTPAMRHFDRGWHQRDEGRFQHVEYVFGASAAAALYRREMIEDISAAGEFFDPDFFAYREDADVAWRGQLCGWTCLYIPAATAYHVRTMVPGNRGTVCARLNMHCVKNRFLMRVKNMTWGLYWRYWLPATLRDLVVISGCLLYEPTSLPAFWHIAKSLRRAFQQRRLIMSRRRVDDRALARWFRFQSQAARSACEDSTVVSQPPTSASNESSSPKSRLERSIRNVHPNLLPAAVRQRNPRRLQS
jgi:GT2 family glycosyltransferase